VTVSVAGVGVSVMVDWSGGVGKVEDSVPFDVRVRLVKPPAAVV
jgi:hypothetical protein